MNIIGESYEGDEVRVSESRRGRRGERGPVGGWPGVSNLKKKARERE